MSTNIVVVSGRIGKDPEIKSTNSGKSVTSFSLAVDEGFGDKKKTLWLQVEAWDKTAEAINRLSGKGKRILIEGRIGVDTWEQNGETKTRTKIIANRVEFIDFLERSQADGYQEQDDSDTPF